MKRISCVVFSFMMLCVIGCTGFDRLMTTLDDNWRDYDIDSASVQELLIYV